MDGLPTSAQEEPKQESPSQEPSSTVTKPSGIRILVELRMTNGLHMSCYRRYNDCSPLIIPSNVCKL